jgi:hypothetical protein
MRAWLEKVARIRSPYTVPYRFRHQSLSLIISDLLSHRTLFLSSFANNVLSKLTFMRTVLQNSSIEFELGD